MSIRAELCKAAEITEKRGEDFQAFALRLCAVVGNLPDPLWNGLSKEATDWFNVAVDKGNEKPPQPLPAFPDEKAADPEPTTRRRARAADPAPAEYKPAKGDKVNLTTKRGKSYEGAEIVVLDEKGLVIAINDNEKDDVDLDFDRIEKIELVGNLNSAKSNAEPDGPVEPHVGATVQLETARGKIVMGIVIEMTDTLIVVKDTTGAEDEYPKDRLKSIIVKASAAGAAASPAPAPAARGRSRADAAPPTPPATGGNTKSTNEPGVSISARIQELIIANMAATEKDICATLTKEGLNFKENTVTLNFKAIHKLLTALKAAGKLK